ncbi:uncharacterized protein LOC110101379 [Dendrobium catenatum]|uniref:uncharacterized protein LOC110101379 n=1 Tax=Dendrobium catenatum TaxID=906689 RepID=UPI0009F6C552|nr:uncharacterized protein LOC110101379 [Dendrobium catenatum]
MADSTIPANLKFVVSNIKNFVTTPLAADNYAIWRSQILKIIRANGFYSFLVPPPSLPTSSDQIQEGSSSSTISTGNRHLTDQTLSAALCSTISHSILPYVISLESTAEICTSQKIKSLVDQIVAADSTVDIEDIILYILNGLPPTYQSFKTSIRTMLNPISLDQLYPLLLSEEIHLAADAARQHTTTDPNMALFGSRGVAKGSAADKIQTQWDRPDPTPPAQSSAKCASRKDTPQILAGIA